MQLNVFEQTLATYRKECLPFYQKMKAYPLDREQKTLDKFHELLSKGAACTGAHYFDPGHLTGSALLLSKDYSRVVLTLHSKLNKWLQLGGHAENDSSMHAVALREASEESGITSLALANIGAENGRTKLHPWPLPLDFDVHFIPAHKDKPAHYHYDVRYIVVAEDEDLLCSNESLDLRWFTIEEARKMNAEESMQRQFDKLALLIKEAWI